MMVAVLIFMGVVFLFVTAAGGALGASMTGKRRELRWLLRTTHVLVAHYRTTTLRYGRDDRVKRWGDRVLGFR